MSGPPATERIDPALDDLCERALDVAVQAGAAFAEARVVEETSESIDVRNTALKGARHAATSGIGVRVIAGGAWGFAATSRLETPDVEAAARLAVEIAASSKALRAAPVRLASEEPVRISWASPLEEDPFTVPLEEKAGLLLAATERIREVSGVAIAEGMINLWRRTTLLRTSEGSRIEQTVVHSGAGITAIAVGGDEIQQRSYPNSFRGDLAARGFEHIRAMDLPANAGAIAEEAAALLRAPACPAGETTLILDGRQLALQVHESVGHPVELDRVLGMEAAYAGTSFLRPEDRGRFRYASDQVTLTADATLPGALASFGYDDEGVPAQRVTLVEEGIFQRFLTSRETAAAVGEPRSNGTARASGWDVIPLIRMTNVNLEPGASSLEEMIEGTPEGILMSTNRSWSIDDRRVNFQFGCEIAWEIRRGKRRRMLRNPAYGGRTVEFWSSCDAVAGPPEWRVWGIPNCGKGQPAQLARVAHGTAPARFRGVHVGVRQ